MARENNSYFLPSHPSIVSLDPLAVCEVDNPPAWDVITTTIGTFRAHSTSTIHHLPQLVQDLSYSVKMDGNVDTGFLARFLGDTFPDPGADHATAVLNAVLDAALSLPAEFPSHTLRYLNASNASCDFNKPQILSLLAHQLLNTLTPPPSNDWGCTFSVWYSEPQALDLAVMGYLRTLFEFFAQARKWNGLNVVFMFRERSEGDSVKNELDNWKIIAHSNLFSNLRFECASNQDTPFPHERIPCILVASNKSPGFGSACTQEELVTAACPPLLIMGALLIKSPLSAGAVLIAQGNLPVAQWKGQGRNARYQQLIPPQRRTFIFLDAAELDAMERTFLPDLEPEYLVRDLNKAYTGFSALAALGEREVASPLWGAGSFGGDPLVKVLILGAAAARSGIKVSVLVEEERYLPTGSLTSTGLYRCLEELKTRCGTVSVGEMICRLSEEETGQVTGTVELLGML